MGNFSLEIDNGFSYRNCGISNFIRCVTKENFSRWVCIRSKKQPNGHNTLSDFLVLCCLDFEGVLVSCSD